MNIADLQYNFYGAQISNASIGPRREVILDMELWPERNGKQVPSWRRGDGTRIIIRFGGIHNFSEATIFFSTWPENRNANCGLHHLGYDPDRTSRRGDVFVQMAFDSTDDSFTIH